MHHSQFRRADTDLTLLTAKRGVDKETSWLNQLVEIIWPRINRYIKTLLEERVKPAIDQALPSTMRGSVVVERLSIGKSTPRFGHMHVKSRSDEAIIMDLKVDITSDLDIELKAMHIPLGISAFTFHGVLTVCLRPPIFRPPFFGGIEVYFVNPPDLGIVFTGAATVAGWSTIKGAIHDVLMTQVANTMVVPARIAMDLVDDDEFDDAELKYPEPVGVLRFLLKSGRGLRAADIGWTSSSSDPYVNVHIGQQSWRSSTVWSTLNPVWTHGNVADFLIYDLDQVAIIDVYDEDKLSQDDFLGRARIRGFSKLVLAKGAVVDEEFVVSDDQGAPQGSLSVSMRWFDLRKEAPSMGISPAVARGPSQLVLRAKLEDIHGRLPTTAAAPFFVRLTVAKGGCPDIVQTTAASHAVPIKAASTEMRHVIQKLADRDKVTMHDISEITGLTEHEVQKALGQEISPSQKKLIQENAQRTNPCFRQTLRILLPWTSEMMNNAVVRLEVLDNRQRSVLDRFEAPLASVAWKESLGPFPLAPDVALCGSLCTRWLGVPGKA